MATEKVPGTSKLVNVIAAAFQRLLERSELTESDHRGFTGHREQIQTRLSGTFEVSKFMIIGSYSRGCAIRQTSDLDLMIVLRRNEVMWGGSLVSSDGVLERVRRDLASRFPNTALGRDGQAVVVDFADGRAIDVVPAYFGDAQATGWPVYRIPRGDGGWLPTAPDSHGKYLSEADRRSGGKLKNVARIAKYWRTTRETPVPLSSFYVELVLATTDVCRVAESHTMTFARLLVELESRGCGPVADPLGVSGTIAGCASEAKRTSAMRTISAASQRAVAAVEAEQKGKLDEALRFWDVVFNGGFAR